MKIGVLGGTFDPPHKAHLELARAALTQLELDEVIFVPASKNPLKKLERMSSAKHRLRMVELMIREEPRMAACDLEVVKGGISYTVETMTELAIAQPGDYWFIAGGDAIASMENWKQPERLVKICRIAAAVRAPLTRADIERSLSANLRPFVDFIEMPPLAISSSDIRKKLATTKGQVLQMDPQVAAYARDHRLYTL